MITLNINLPVTIRPIFKPWNRTFIPLSCRCGQIRCRCVSMRSMR